MEDGKSRCSALQCATSIFDPPSSIFEYWRGISLRTSTSLRRTHHHKAGDLAERLLSRAIGEPIEVRQRTLDIAPRLGQRRFGRAEAARSEEHTSELQSRG